MCQAVDLAENLSNHILGVDPEVKEGFIIDDGLYPFVRFELTSNVIFGVESIRTCSLPFPKPLQQSHPLFLVVCTSAQQL